MVQVIGVDASESSDVIGYSLRYSGGISEVTCEITIGDSKPKKDYPVTHCTKCKRLLDSPEDWEKIPQEQRDNYLKWCGEQKIKPLMLCCYCLHDYFEDLGLSRRNSISLWACGDIITECYVGDEPAIRFIQSAQISDVALHEALHSNLQRLNERRGRNASRTPQRNGFRATRIEDLQYFYDEI